MTTETFDSLFMPSHTAFIQTGMTISGWPEGYDDKPKPGDEFYLIDVFWTNTGRGRLDATKQPGRKNMSGEQCVDGWLGETNNVSLTAMGRWRIIHAEPAKDAPNNAYWTVTAERIDAE